MAAGDYSEDYTSGYFVSTDGVGEQYVVPSVFGAGSDVSGFAPSPGGRVLDTYWTDRRAGSPLFSRVTVARTPFFLCRQDGTWSATATAPEVCERLVGGGHADLVDRNDLDEMLLDGVITQALYDETILSPV